MLVNGKLVLNSDNPGSEIHEPEYLLSKMITFIL